MSLNSADSSRLAEHGNDESASRPGRPEKLVKIFVDYEPLEIESKTTPNEILAAAGLDPATHYLVMVEGRHRTSYKGEGDKVTHVRNADTFVSLSTGPTPTS